MAVITNEHLSKSYELMQEAERKTCRWNGLFHRFVAHIESTDLVILTCECGEVKWVDRPKEK